MKCLALVLIALSACEETKKAPPSDPIVAPAPAPTKPPYDKMRLAQFLPLVVPADENVDPGRAIYFEKCNRCHDVTKNGAGGQVDRRNAPTVFNAAAALPQGWIGQWATLEDALVPHGKLDPSQTKSVAAYVRKLVTPSRWDKFLAGNEAALTAEEKEGLGTFLDEGCSGCHAGRLLGGTSYQKVGLTTKWPGPTGEDKGRFEITKAEPDLHVFKVPTLRNVTKTGPWMHDGSLNSLEETVKLMSRHEVGKEITDAKVKSIVEFLGALNGDPPAALAKKPETP